MIIFISIKVNVGIILNTSNTHTLIQTVTIVITYVRISDRLFIVIIYCFLYPINSIYISIMHITHMNSIKINLLHIFMIIFIIKQ